ncbi:MAG: Response regulator receiver protein [uncultured bacterium]|nr:MAG: Response regulator receiver protein [uncultured bacterium]
MNPMRKSRQMYDDVVIIVAEDDIGHASLIKRNLARAGINNEILHLSDGEQALNFLFRTGEGPVRDLDKQYLLLLDIRMPKVSGIEVLEEIKKDSVLKKLPVIMVTTTDDPKDVDKCHLLGCSNYITKPIEYEKFIEVVQKLGFFLKIVSIPSLSDS